MFDVNTTHINANKLDGDVVPVRYTDEEGKDENPILIVKLAKNQKIDVQCIVRKGIGKEHAKWSPVATVAMQQIPKIQFDKLEISNMTPHEKIDIVKSCPAKVYKYDQEKDLLEIENLGECHQCQECTVACSEMNKEGAIKVGLEEDRFLFTVESTGALPPDQIVLKALEILSDKFSTLEQLVSSAPEVS